MPADLLTVSKSASRNRGGKSVSRFRDCEQICQSANLLAEKGGNLPADLLTVSKSASRNSGGKSVSRFRDCEQICQSANLLAEKGGNLPADLVTVSKSASRNLPSPLSASRFTDSQEICWQNTRVFLPVLNNFSS